MYTTNKVHSLLLHDVLHSTCVQLGALASLWWIIWCLLMLLWQASNRNPPLYIKYIYETIMKVKNFPTSVLLLWNIRKQRRSSLNLQRKHFPPTCDAFLTILCRGKVQTVVQDSDCLLTPGERDITRMLSEVGSGGVARSRHRTPKTIFHPRHLLPSASVSPSCRLISGCVDSVICSVCVYTCCDHRQQRLLSPHPSIRCWSLHRCVSADCGLFTSRRARSGRLWVVSATLVHL